MKKRDKWFIHLLGWGHQGPGRHTLVQDLHAGCFLRWRASLSSADSHLLSQVVNNGSNSPNNASWVLVYRRPNTSSLTLVRMRSWLPYQKGVHRSYTKHTYKKKYKLDVQLRTMKLSRYGQLPLIGSADGKGLPCIRAALAMEWVACKPELRDLKETKEEKVSE